MSKMLRLAVSLAAVMAALAGCGGGSSGSSAGGSSAAGTPAQGTEGTGQAIVDPATLRSGGAATIAAAQGIAQLDPYKFLFTFESVVHALMYSSLTQYTIDGGEQVKPDLATSWKASKNFRTYTFKLRSGLRFSNGKPLTAQAVAASLKRAFDPKTAFVWAFFLPKVDAIQAPDADTVRITLKAPERSLPAAMTRIPIEDVTTLKQIDHDPVVTGQYKVASFTPDQNLVLERNPDYHGPPAKLDRVTVTKAQDNTAAFTSLRAGDIQVLWSIPWTDVRQLTGGDDGKIVVNTGDKPLQNVILMTDNKHGIFTNVKARQAVAYALDRAAVLKAIYADRGVVPRGNDPVPPWSDLAKKDLPSYDFDLNKAKALFKEAGFGPNTPLTYLTPTGQYTEWTSIGEVLQNDLKKIGIPMKIETVEINQYAARIAPAGKKWPNVIAPNIYGGLPVSLIPAWWAPGVCECNFDNAAYNKALTDAEAAPDDTAFRAAVDQSQEVFNAQVPSVLVVHTALPVATVSSLKNVWIDPTGNARFGDAGYAK